MTTSGKVKDLTSLLLSYLRFLQTSQTLSSLCVWINLKVVHLLWNHMCPLIPCPITQGAVSRCSGDKVTAQIFRMTSPSGDWGGESIEETASPMIGGARALHKVRLHFLYSSRQGYVVLRYVVSCLIWFCKIRYHISMCRVASACFQVSGFIRTFQPWVC